MDGGGRDLNTFFEILALTAGTGLALAWLPQLVKNIKTKSVDDESLLTIATITGCLACLEVWAFASIGHRWAYAATNGLAVVIVGAVLVSVLVYRR